MIKQDEILEIYNPPLVHYEMNEDDEIEEIYILRKQILTSYGATAPTFLCKRKNDKFLTGCDDSNAGYPTKEQCISNRILDYLESISNNTLEIADLYKQINSYKESIQKLKLLTK